LQLILRLASENIVSFDQASSLAGMSLSEFHSILTNTLQEDTTELYSPMGTTFLMAWDNDEPEYSLDDLKTINPSYEVR